jgi:hypothetical protein
MAPPPATGLQKKICRILDPLFDPFSDVDIEKASDFPVDPPETQA